MYLFFHSNLFRSRRAEVEGERYRDADGVLVNTFDAIDPGAAAVLWRHEPCRPPVFPVRPLIRRADEGEDATSCSEWLDAQPDSSGRYVLRYGESATPALPRCASHGTRGVCLMSLCLAGGGTQLRLCVFDIRDVKSICMLLHGDLRACRACCLWRTRQPRGVVASDAWTRLC